MWSRAEKRKSREEEEAVTLLGENLFSTSLIFLWSHFRTRQHWLAEIILSLFLYFFFLSTCCICSAALKKRVYIYNGEYVCVLTWHTEYEAMRLTRREGEKAEDRKKKKERM